MAIKEDEEGVALEITKKNVISLKDMWKNPFLRVNIVMVGLYNIFGDLSKFYLNFLIDYLPINVIESNTFIAFSFLGFGVFSPIYSKLKLSI